MAAVNIIIPTFKRAGNVKGFNYFKSSKLCVSESQSAEYARHYGKRRLLVMPDEFEGNIARKRNWILRNVKRPLLMVDDDVEHIATWEKGNRKKVNHIKIKPDKAMDVVAAGFNLAHQWGCVMWGINVNASRVIYQQYKPFSLTQCVLGPFSAHLDHNLFYDERMKSKDDYDFSLQVLQRHKKILRLNKFYYKCDHGDNDGGIVSMRSMRAEKEACRAIMRKWGTDIIRYNLNAKKITDLLNAVVNIPIKGV